MSQKTTARIERIAYIGWRGIDGCEVLDLDKGPLTGFIGPSGAGKSTLIMCLDYALLPDKDALKIQPISDVQDSQKAGVDSLAERIDPQYGFAYVALDITTRTGSRLIAGIYVETSDGHAEFTRWLIRDAGDIPLRSILGQEVDDHEIFPPFPEFKRLCAGRGLDVTKCRSVGEYCQALYEAGILPSSMTNGQDRKLYANLIETTFRGGVSNKVVSRLKDYLLPEASQVPDIVRGLQECTDEVVKTRSALASAEKELTLLQSTYGVGKNIGLHALRWMMETERNIKARLTADNQEKANLQATLNNLAEDIPRIKKEIEQAAATKETMLQTALGQLKIANIKLGELRGNLPQLNQNLSAALSNKTKFNKGKGLWEKIADTNAHQSLESVSDWLKSRRKEAERQAIGIENELGRIQEEINRLSRGEASVLSETLAGQTGGHTLAKEFDESSMDEALAAELSLCGLTDGVIGIELNELESLASSESLPDTFWFGANAPQIAALNEVGDWYVNSVAGGYVATKKTRIPVFGSKARAKRLEELAEEIKKRTHRHGEARDEAEKCDVAKTSLDENKEIISFYLAQRDIAIEIENAVKNASAAIDAQNQEIGEAENAAQEIEETIKSTGKPYEEILQNLNTDLHSKERKQSDVIASLAAVSKRIELTQTELEAVHEEKQEAEAILGKDAPLMFEGANAIDEFSEETILIEQTRRIGALGSALHDESPSRLALLQEADPRKRLTTLKLWPALMEIVRERVSIDRAEIDGEDLIKAMKEHRSKLDGELVVHENEVRIRARNIYQTINSNIVSQQRKIDKLSKLGTGIQFGNVTGIQIVLKPRWEMMSVLESFAEQLFSEKKPVDVALKEWFDAASSKQDGISLTGQELLDYRNYVDLSIEACRKGTGWAPATLLSGGEAIGCGLAMALMLTRSIAAKGDIKPDEISPLFAVDEVHRLDGPGQKMIVNFAERERFQVIVTAVMLAPDYNCILYSLNRVFDPTERLVIRGMRINGDKKAA